MGYWKTCCTCARAGTIIWVIIEEPPEMVIVVDGQSHWPPKHGQDSTISIFAMLGQMRKLSQCGHVWEQRFREI